MGRGAAELPGRLAREWRIASQDANAGAAARREFTEHLRRYSADDDGLTGASIVFGELVSNAIRCARSEVLVELAIDRSAILRVIDDGECFHFDRIKWPTDEAEHGRGLSIVNAFSHRLTVERKPFECRVTAYLRLRIS